MGALEQAADRLHRRDRRRQARPADAARVGPPAPGATGRSRSSARSASATLTTDISALAAEPNVHLLGVRSYREISPSVLRAADAGLIPYARNELTESIFPMKVYEYLAAGLPVLATPLPALAEVADVLSAADAGAARRAAREGARRRTAPRGAPRARAAAAGHSWDRRLEEIGPRRSRRCERPARQHPHARARHRPGAANLRDRARSRHTRR